MHNDDSKLALIRLTNTATTNVMQQTINIIPTLRYRDAAKAIEWLCAAFGMTQQLVVPGEDGTIAHAQLRYNNGMIMLGTVRDDEFGKLLAPVIHGQPVTSAIHVVVEDVDAHHAKATENGAVTITAPEDQPYGGRYYACRDVEGYVWSFGTYDPMA